jgi:hypothetical protein
MAYTTIKKPSDYFNTVLYTGTGATQSITGVGFQPDFCWFKSRTSGESYRVFDAVRGATKHIVTNDTSAESTDATGLTSFNTDGFSLSTGNPVNANSQNFASWNWLANGAGSANTDGSISSTVSANTTSGFSIVTWTSTGSAHTVGHGLNSTPAMIIMKGRHEANSWMVYHHKNTSAPETDYLELNSTVATADYTVWNDTAPTSSVFSLGTWSGNDASGTMVAYCFAEKQGFSKFGSYIGNGNADGTFVYTGFKPSWVMIKNTSTSNDWFMIDNSRDTLSPNNPVGRKSLFANTNGAEVTRTTKDMDFLSNGIKLRTADGTQNNSGENYIYMAFAEQPLVGDNPATAR